MVRNRSYFYGRIHCFTYLNVLATLVMLNKIKVQNNKNHIRFWINFFVIFIFITLVCLQASKKFVLDEIDFPAVAKTISETGLPYEYRGVDEQRALGLWHPPMYAYALGGFIKLWGYGEITVRIFGLICTLLSAFLCLMLYKETLNTTWSAANSFATLFLPLYLLHPYTLANTTLPDIDSTVLPITILLFLHGISKLLKHTTRANPPDWFQKDFIYLSILFALNLWTKLTTPLALIPILSIALYLNNTTFLKSIGTSVLVAVLGGTIFVVTYYLYCHAMSLPFDYVFRFLVSSFTKNSSGNSGLFGLVNTIQQHFTNLKYFANWWGLPFIFALAIATSALVFQKNKLSNDKLISLLLGFGLFVPLFYICLTDAFGEFFKYPFPTFGLLVLIISHQLHRLSTEKNTNKILITDLYLNKYALLIVTTGIAISVLYYQIAFKKDSAILNNLPVNSALLAGLILSGGVIGLVFSKFFKTGIVKVLSAILFAVLMGNQLGISYIQAVAEYPTKYHYGQRGLDETVLYLRTILPPNETIWSMKDIGHYSAGTYIENYGAIFGDEPKISANLRAAIQQHNVKYFVVTKDVGQDRIDAYPDLKLALDLCCSVNKEFGNFVIYKAK